MIVHLLAACGPAPEPPGNILFVTLDTVRADHLGPYGYGKAQTPVIDALAARGTVFDNAVSVAPITMPTHSSLFTGRYPTNHGVRNNGGFVLQPEQVTLAESLKGQGYDTAALVSALVLDSKFGLDQGFRVYDDDLYAGSEQKLFMFKEVRAEVTVNKALTLLPELQEPWFVWVHLFDAHADYEPPPPFDVLFLDNPYDGEIAYVDEQLGRLFDAVDPAKTTIAVTADHGDSLGDHGEQTHGIFVYRSTTHVPLIVAGPGVPTQRVSPVVSQVDVAPSLAELAGADLPDVDGISLAGVLRGRGGVPSRPDGGVYKEALNPRLHFGWHELRGFDSGTETFIEAPTPERYALTSDPGELTNLFVDPDTSGLRAKLAALTDDVSQLRAEPVDAQTKDMLVALGYADEVADVDPDASLPDPKDVVHTWVELQRCQAQVRHRQLVPARECLLALLAKNPGNWPAQMSLAGVYRRSGQPAEAKAILLRLIDEKPGDIKALESLAEAHQLLGEFDDAEQVLLRATQASPNDPEPWALLGELYHANKRGKDAIAAFGEALRRDRKYVQAYIGLGNAFHHGGRRDKALEYLDQAVAIEPSNLAAWYNRGVVLELQGRSGAAEEAYRKAVEIDPKHALSHNNLGSLLHKQGRNIEAEQAFRRALAIDAEHVEARYNLATLLMDGRPEQAVPLLQRVVATRPGLLPARHNLAVGLERLERPDEALEQYRAIVAADPKAVGAMLAMARLALGAGNRSEATAQARAAVAVGGDEIRQRIAQDPVLKVLKL